MRTCGNITVLNQKLLRSRHKVRTFTIMLASDGQQVAPFFWVPLASIAFIYGCKDNYNMLRIFKIIGLTTFAK